MSYCRVKTMDQGTLVKEIKTLSDSIRRKNRALKLGISERENFIEATFKPVVAPLKELSEKIDTKLLSKNESANIIPVSNEKKGLKTEEESSESVDETDYTEEAENYEEEAKQKAEDVDVSNQESSHLVGEDHDTNVSDISMLANDITTKGLLTRKYLLQMLQSTRKGKRYHVYGARLENNGLMIGDSPLVMDDVDNLIIKGKTYHGTTGLFELIFKTIPSKYNARDLNTYKSILKSTNAHKKNYLVKSPIHRNGSKKYANIISKIFPSNSVKTTGSGLSMKSVYNTNIIYYNNVNKIVNRLRLLWEAKQAGHSGVDNEIVALTDELRQRGYIK